METKRIRKVAVAGIVLLSAATYAHAQTRIGPQPSPPARSYLCFEGGTAGDVMKKANEAGARGWKMVAATGQGSSAVWCFEQLSAIRPAASR